MSTTSARRGLFITFEGSDGCGKTTQMHRLAERLRAAGHEVMETAEPGGTPIGRQIRAILLDSANRELSATAELLLYFASRAQNVEVNPDLTITIDIDLETSLRRAHARNRTLSGADEKRIDEESAEFHKRVREAYHELARLEPGRIRMVDGNADENTVAKRVWDAVKEHFR